MNDWLKKEFPDLLFANESEKDLKKLKENPAFRSTFKAVGKALNHLNARDFSYPSLKTHPFHSKFGANGEKVLQSYAQNNTPGAYRIFWHYGPEKGEITILAITSHP